MKIFSIGPSSHCSSSVKIRTPRDSLFLPEAPRSTTVGERVSILCSQWLFLFFTIAGRRSSYIRGISIRQRTRTRFRVEIKARRPNAVDAKRNVPLCDTKRIPVRDDSVSRQFTRVTDKGIREVPTARIPLQCPSRSGIIVLGVQHRQIP